MQIEAPAKVNLSLRVLGRREDGFHEIETLMVPLSVADRLTLERRETAGVELACDDPTLPTDSRNLAYRAADLFLAEAGAAGGVRIALEKRIPHGAGLAGGSSDAASVLMGLNELFGDPLPEGTLAGLAALAGSDVPFFLMRGAAVCRGRGERVERADFTAKLPLLLVKPPFGVPTPWAYGRWRDAVEIPGVDYWKQVFDWGTLMNDLERPVFEKYVFLAMLKRWLRDQPETVGALMAGSGATVFAVLREASEGPALAARVKSELGETMWTCVCTAG